MRVSEIRVKLIRVNQGLGMPHFKAFGMMNLQYEVRICHKIHNKGRMSQWQIQVTIFLSGTDVMCY